mgnify:CR=1 FL=1
MRNENIPPEKKHRWWTSGLLIIIVIIILSIVGCDNVLAKLIPQEDSTPEGLTLSLVSERSMSSLELAHSLALAVRSNRSSEAVYSSIPRTQTDGLDQTSFFQFIQALKKGITSPITEIIAMDNDEKEVILTLLEGGNPAIYELAQRSDFYALHYENDSNDVGFDYENDSNDVGFVVAIQKDEDGVAYLDQDWTQGIISIDNYMMLYFEAINNNSFDALYALLESSVNPASEIEKEVLTARCQATLDYYHNEIRTQGDQLELQRIYPGYAEIEQYATLTSNLNQRIRRIIRFQERDNYLIATDPVTETLRVEDLSVIANGETLITLDEDLAALEVSSADFDKILGTPLSHGSDSCFRIAEGLDIFTVEYPGIIITVLGDCTDEHQNWSGVVTRAEISYSNFALGSGLSPGLHINELYLRYPFARENDYLLQRQIDDFTFTLAIQVEAGHIAKLTLTSDY